MTKILKKNKELTLEENLEQSVVSNLDGLYKLPDNWCWVKMSCISKLISKGTTPTGGRTAYQNSGVSFLRVENINDDGTISHENIAYINEDIHKFFLKRSILNDKDVLVSIAGTLGKTGIVREIDLPLNTNQAIAFIRLISDVANEKYVKYAIDTPIIQKLLLSKAKVTAIPNLTLETISNCPIPLPPISEQKRIVEHIENLFAKLNEAKEKAQEVIDGFENRKAAILHKAFTGELTEKWRNENDVSKDSWRPKKINQVCFPRAGYAFDSKKFTNTGYQIIRMGNLYGGELDLNRNPVFISADDVDETVLRRALINDGDILITLTGTKYKRDYGYAVCIHNPINLLVNQRILCLTPNYNEIKTDYLLFYLQSDLFRNVFFSNETGGVNQGNVSSKFVENIEVDIPTLDEQAEIGRILCDILEKEQQTKDTAETVIEQIDTIKKAILARAFRGELGTNNPDEESAVELLKQILKGDE